MKKNICIIVIAVVLIFAIEISTWATSLSNELEDKKNDLSNAQDQMNEVKVELSQTLKQIQELDTSIKSYESEIDQLNSQIQNLNTNIEATQARLDVAQEDLDRQQQALEARLVALYEAGDTTYLDVLLSSNGVFDFITNYSLITELAEADSILLEKLESSKNEIETSKIKLEEQKEQIKTAKDSKEKTSLALQNSKTLKNNYMSKLSDEEKDLQKQIDQYKADIRKLEDDIAKASGQNNGGNYLGGIMAWPTPGYTYITSPYGPRIHPVYGYQITHTGIDIGAPYGARAVAADDGVVTLATYYGGYGNCVMINHGGGVSTLYAHGSQIKVRVGDTVKRGDTVLIVGSTGVSTGAHLHFEVRLNGRHTNPIPYLK